MKNSMENVQYRRERMLAYLRRVRRAQVQEMATRVRVTPMTVRRDLDVFEAAGQVRRSYGVAVYTGREDADVVYAAPTGDLTPAARAVARTAASLIEDGDTVFFNSSATVLGILEYLGDRRVTVVTNNGRALYAHRTPGVELILTGGDVYGQKQSLVGELAAATLSRVTATKCVLGVSGISAEDGITSSISLETPVNQAMLRRCTGMRVVAADGSKIGVKRNFFSGSVENITHLITTRDADPAELEKIRARGVTILFAEEE